MKLKIVFYAAFCGLATMTGLLSAAEPVRSDRATSAAALAPGEVDIERSRAYVRIGATGLGHEHGAEGRIVAGTVRLGAKSGAGEIEFDMRSFVAETAASRKAVGLTGTIDASTAKQVTDNMLGADVLHVKKYPTATLVIDSALPSPAQKGETGTYYQLDGQFTLHGVTKPLSLRVQVQSVAGEQILQTKFSVLQKQYGIKPYTKLLGTVGVADKLDIWGYLVVATSAHEAAQPPRRKR